MCEKVDYRNRFRTTTTEPVAVCEPRSRSVSAPTVLRLFNGFCRRGDGGDMERVRREERGTPSRKDPECKMVQKPTSSCFN